MNEANSQLQDKNFYIPVSHDPTKHIQYLVAVVCWEALSLGIIDDYLYDYLKVPFPRIPLFYTLPKIHKGTNSPAGVPDRQRKWGSP